MFAYVNTAVSGGSTLLPSLPLSNKHNDTRMIYYSPALWMNMDFLGIDINRSRWVDFIK